MTIYWVGSPKYTAGHPAPLIALVHHRMVGTLRSTDAAFTSTDGREASTNFGVGYGCGRTGHPTSAHVHQYVRLGDQAWGNGNWDPSGAWDDRYPTTLVNSRTVSIEHHDNGGRTAGTGKGVIPRARPSQPRSRSMPCCCAAYSVLPQGRRDPVPRKAHRDHPRAPGDPSRPAPPHRPPLHRRAPQALLLAALGGRPDRLPAGAVPRRSYTSTDRYRGDREQLPRAQGPVGRHRALGHLAVRDLRARTLARQHPGRPRARHALLRPAASTVRMVEYVDAKGVHQGRAMFAKATDVTTIRPAPDPTPFSQAQLDAAEKTAAAAVKAAAASAAATYGA